MTILGIDITDWLMLFAILIGPIAAVQVQKRIESFKDRRNRQLFIFRTLMATRATPLAHDHVVALNLIDIDFSEKIKKEKPVVRAWRVLLDQFGKFPRANDIKDQNEYLISLNAASQRSQDCLVELLAKMAETLGYDFETIHIRNGCYAPTGHAEIENDNKWIRKGVLGVLGGNIPINMNVKSLPEQAPHESVANVFKTTAVTQQKMFELLDRIARGETNIQVSLSSPMVAREQDQGKKSA